MAALAAEAPVEAPAAGSTPSKPTNPTKPTDPTEPTTPTEPSTPASGAHVAYVTGYEDKTIRPDNNITRAEAALL